jgi:hypothetical protein
MTDQIQFTPAAVKPIISREDIEVRELISLVGTQPAPSLPSRFKTTPTLPHVQDRGICWVHETVPRVASMWLVPSFGQAADAIGAIDLHSVAGRRAAGRAPRRPAQIVLWRILTAG